MCERSFMVYPFLMLPACDLTHGVDYDYEYWDLLRRAEFMYYLYPVSSRMLQNASQNFVEKLWTWQPRLKMPDSGLIIIFHFNKCAKFRVKPILN